MGMKGVVGGEGSQRPGEKRTGKVATVFSFVLVLPGGFPGFPSSAAV